jgi:hypothetical protein
VGPLGWHGGIFYGVAIQGIENTGRRLVPDARIVAGSDEMVRFVNYWLELRKADGMYERERNYWIRGQPSATLPPRWSVVRDVLHWVK